MRSVQFNFFFIIKFMVHIGRYFDAFALHIRHILLINFE